MRNNYLTSRELKTLAISVFIIFSMLFHSTVGAEAARLTSAKTHALASDVRVDAEKGKAGDLYARIDGTERKIADGAISAWLVEGGRYVVYSSRDGAGGYENEGQSLWIYDPQAGKQRKILSEYYAIDRVTEVKTHTGKLALLVEMSDSGLGASHLSVVDPARGEVFSKSKVKLLRHSGDFIVLGYYKDKDWESMANGNEVRPYRTERYSLSRIIKGRVIVNAQQPRP